MVSPLSQAAKCCASPVKRNVLETWGWCKVAPSIFPSKTTPSMRRLRRSFFVHCRVPMMRSMNATRGKSGGTVLLLEHVRPGGLLDRCSIC